MPNLNRVFLMGNLTRDPEIRYLPSNTAVANFGMAINRRWRSQEGEQREETTYVECSAFGRTGEVINQYMRKGRPIFVDGRLRFEQWQDKESGAKRSRLSVVVENFQFIESRGGESQQPADPEAQGAPATPSSVEPPAPSASQGAHQPVNESDIPF